MIDGLDPMFNTFIYLGFITKALIIQLPVSVNSNSSSSPIATSTVLTHIAGFSSKIQKNRLITH